MIELNTAGFDADFCKFIDELDAKDDQTVWFFTVDETTYATTSEKEACLLTVSLDHPEVTDGPANRVASTFFLHLLKVGHNHTISRNRSFSLAVKIVQKPSSKALTDRALAEFD